MVLGKNVHKIPPASLRHFQSEVVSGFQRAHGHDWDGFKLRESQKMFGNRVPMKIGARKKKPAAVPSENEKNNAKPGLLEYFEQGIRTFGKALHIW